MDKISYGLYAISVKDNACIVNTVMQVTDNPNQIALCINKNNYTHDILLKEKKLAVNILSIDTPMSVFENFGFQSGKNIDKFKNFNNGKKDENGIFIFNKYINSYIIGTVFKTIDLKTHTLFLASVIKFKNISDRATMTYSYYHENVKPKKEKAKGFICKVCSYVYEGETLPFDFICPICKHTAEAFEKIL